MVRDKHYVTVSLLLTMALTACEDSASLPNEVVRRWSLEAVTDTDLTGTVGTAVNPAPIVRILDPDGTPATGVVVRFDIAPGSGTIVINWVRTDVDGRATSGPWVLGETAGPQTVTARSEWLADVVFTAVAMPGPVEQITRIGGDYQIAIAGSTLALPLQVLVADRFGNPVSDAPVTFAVFSGDGSIEGNAAVTDSVGVAASGLWTLGPKLGLQRVGARAGNDGQLFETQFTATACDDRCSERQLLFVRDGSFYLTDLLGTTPRQLPNGSGHSAAWSPDGARIAFVRNSGLYVMDADGSNAVLRAVDFGFPAWSPDGRLLAVNDDDCVYHCDLYLMSATDDGTPPRKIASEAAHPSWSPDGNQIAFVRLSGDDGYHILAAMSSDGSQISEITLLDEGAIFNPTWSPDGQRIAFTKCYLGGCNVFTVSPDARAVPHSTLEQITTVGHADEPTWSPDGLFIAFSTRSGPAFSIAYVAADGGGNPIPLVSPGHSPAFRPRPPELGGRRHVGNQVKRLRFVGSPNAGGIQ